MLDTLLQHGGYLPLGDLRNLLIADLRRMSGWLLAGKTAACRKTTCARRKHLGFQLRQSSRHNAVALPPPGINETVPKWAMLQAYMGALGCQMGTHVLAQSPQPPERTRLLQRPGAHQKEGGCSMLVAAKCAPIALGQALHDPLARQPDRQHCRQPEGPAVKVQDVPAGAFPVHKCSVLCAGQLGPSKELEKAESLCM